MKAIVHSSNLLKELKKLSSVIKKTTVIPVLSCVKLDFAKTGLTLNGTDLETSITLKTNCECKSPFTAIIEYDSIVEACGKLSGLITIENVKTELTLTSEKAKLKFTKNNDEDSFPKPSEDDFKHSVEVDEDFFLSLAAANNCRHSDSMAADKNAACIHTHKDSISLVGTDAFIVYKKDFKINGKEESKIMVADQFVQSVKGMKKATLSIGSKFVKVESESVTVTTLTLNAKFVGYEAVIPESINYNFKSNREELIEAISTVGIAANAATHLVAIHFVENGIKIKAQDNDWGKEGEVESGNIKHSVDFPAIGVSSSQLLKILNLFECEEIEVAFTTANKPMYIRPAQDPHTLSLLMPLMLSPNQ